jgi:hypothetical protein
LCLVDTVRRMAKKALIGLAALALLVVGGAIAFVVRPSGTPRSEVPVALHAQLDAQAADVAVQLQQGDWCVPWVTSCELRCTANVFGMDPRPATTVASVTNAYAVMYCSDRDSAGIDTGSIDIVAPSFGRPPTMRGSPDDATQRDIARVFPMHARAAAWWYYTHPSGFTQ